MKSCKLAATFRPFPLVGGGLTSSWVECDDDEEEMEESDELRDGVRKILEDPGTRSDTEDSGMGRVAALKWGLRSELDCIRFEVPRRLSFVSVVSPSESVALPEESFHVCRVWEVERRKTDDEVINLSIISGEVPSRGVNKFSLGDVCAVVEPELGGEGG